MWREYEYVFWSINLQNFLFHFQVVANYYGNRKDYEPVPTNRIHWAGGRLEPPPDTPKCGFDGSGCPPDGNVIYLSTIVTYTLVRHL